MDKKAYVLRMLEALQTTWPLAKWLMILVEANGVNDVIIDLLITTFEESIKGIQDETARETLEKASSFIKVLKEREEEDKKNDELDIQKMETLLASM